MDKDIPLNCIVVKDGTLSCFCPIETQDDLRMFFDEVIYGELLTQLDSYLKHDYQVWFEDKLAHLPCHLRQKLMRCACSDTTMEEMNEYLEDIGYQAISDLPLPVIEQTLMIGDEIRRVSDVLKLDTLTTKDYLEYAPRCPSFIERLYDIIEA